MQPSEIADAALVEEGAGPAEPLRGAVKGRRGRAALHRAVCRGGPDATVGGLPGLSSSNIYDSTGRRSHFERRHCSLTLLRS